VSKSKTPAKKPTTAAKSQNNASALKATTPAKALAEAHNDTPPQIPDATDK